MITAYITFNGNTEQAFDFYKTALNGTITSIQRFGDTPQGEQLSDTDKNKIMHITLEAADGIKLMGNDFLDFMGEVYIAGNNFALTFHPDNKETADKLFNSLSSGGNITVPMNIAPWGDYFGMFTDKFGIKWMINHQVKS
ncbi:MAG: VOC family protein [Sphingobacteriaceae bacterium]